VFSRIFLKVSEILTSLSLVSFILFLIGSIEEYKVRMPYSFDKRGRCKKFDEVVA
jgi:hypothetical protein